MMIGIIALLVIFIGIGISYFYKDKTEAQRRGEQGEKEIRRQLNQLDRSKYTIINDVQFMIKGKSSQIDHIIVSDFGIFVIETKNYKGIIYGDENSNQWKQVIYQYKNNFYNPIKQNLGHIYALNYVLRQLPVVNYFSLVVFTKRSQLKVKSMTPVVYPHQLIKKIKSQKTVCISSPLKRRIIQEIQSKNLNFKK